MAKIKKRWGGKRARGEMPVKLADSGIREVRFFGRALVEHPTVTAKRLITPHFS
jgi:hypothetical protein